MLPLKLPETKTEANTPLKANRAQGYKAWFGLMVLVISSGLLSLPAQALTSAALRRKLRMMK